LSRRSFSANQRLTSRVQASSVTVWDLSYRDLSDLWQYIVILLCLSCLR